MFSGLIKFFVTHRTAANILMILMLLIGVLSTTRINKQFFPDISIDAIGITVAWSGATAEAVDSSLMQVTVSIDTFNDSPPSLKDRLDYSIKPQDTQAEHINYYNF